MNIAEIESAITKLSPSDVSALMAWLEAYHSQLWDLEIENDLEAGKLDSLLQQVEEEFGAGLAKPL